MAKKSLIAKAKRPTKFEVQKYNRCPLCGRPRAFLRKFGICRICFPKVTSIDQRAEYSERILRAFQSRQVQ